MSIQKPKLPEKILPVQQSLVNWNRRIYLHSRSPRLRHPPSKKSMPSSQKLPHLHLQANPLPLNEQSQPLKPQSPPASREAPEPPPHQVYPLPSSTPPA